MSKYKIEIQDHNSNVYHPHTSAAVVFLDDNTTVEASIKEIKDELGNNKATLEANVNGIKGVL